MGIKWKGGARSQGLKSHEEERGHVRNYTQDKNGHVERSLGCEIWAGSTVVEGGKSSVGFAGRTEQRAWCCSG